MSQAREVSVTAKFLEEARKKCSSLGAHANLDEVLYAMAELVRLEYRMQKLEDGGRMNETP